MPSNDVSFESGEFGVRAILHSRWSDRVEESVSRNGAVEVELNQAKGWVGNDLSFLSRLSHLVGFRLLDFRIADVGAVHLLTNLRHLDLQTYCKTKLDFVAFPDLESCALEWRPQFGGLFGCKKLKKLFLNSYDRSDTQDFGLLADLEHLSLLNAPFANVLGLAPLAKLRSLRLANLRYLESIDGIRGLLSLVDIEINSCPRLQSIDALAGLENIRTLHLNNCSNINSLSPISGCDKLEVLGFYESTNIVDGDLLPIARLKNLKRLSFRNRWHYSHKREDFEAYTGKAGGAV